MNKLIIIGLLAFCFAMVSADDQSFGGYKKVDDSSPREQQAFQVAVVYLREKGLIPMNATPTLLALYEKVVMGELYKFILSYGVSVFQIEVLSQPWLNVLEVYSYSLVSQKS